MGVGLGRAGVGGVPGNRADVFTFCTETAAEKLRAAQLSRTDVQKMFQDETLKFQDETLKSGSYVTVLVTHLSAVSRMSSVLLLDLVR